VLDRFGINIKQAALDQQLLRMGFEKSTKGATEQQKALARLEIISRAMGQQGAIGDAVRTSDQFANTSRRLIGSVKDLGSALGSTVTTSEGVANTLRRVADWLGGIAEWFDTQRPRIAAGFTTIFDGWNASLDLAVAKMGEWYYYVKEKILLVKALMEDLNITIAGKTGGVLRSIGASATSAGVRAPGTAYGSALTKLGGFLSVLGISTQAGASLRSGGTSSREAAARAADLRNVARALADQAAKRLAMIAGRGLAGAFSGRPPGAGEAAAGGSTGIGRFFGFLEFIQSNFNAMVGGTGNGAKTGPAGVVASLQTAIGQYATGTRSQRQLRVAEDSLTVLRDIEVNTRTNSLAGALT
jgi:hypothetical protein